MKTLALILVIAALGTAQDLPAPGFHHLHLNATDPDAAIAFYMKQFPTTSKSSFAGLAALKTGKVLILFSRVASQPALEPQTAIWHFGWHVTDVRQTMARFKETNVRLMPLYTSDEGGSVFINSDSWPGTGGTLGRTKAQIAEAKATNVQPTGGAGFAYLEGPDHALIEYQGNMPAERFNHVHMYQEDPVCAQYWYQKHLNGRVGGRGATRTEADCKVERGEHSWPALEREGTIRFPSGGVLFDDVSMQWYARQGDRPLVPTPGHLADHVALSVADLDAWIAKLQREDVKFLRKVYKLGDTRAVMIEGPSREAIELVEIR